MGTTKLINLLQHLNYVTVLYLPSLSLNVFNSIVQFPLGSLWQISF